MDILTSNIYIIYEIFDYLHLKDLLALAKVSIVFQNAVIEYLSVKYKVVHAHKMSYDFIVSNKLSQDFELKLLQKNKMNLQLPKRENRIVLSHKEFYEFINLISNHIEALFLHYNGYYQRDLKSPYNDKEYFSNLKLNKLKTISFVHLFLTKAEINKIIKNYPNLQEIYCEGILHQGRFGETSMSIEFSDIINIMKILGYVDLCIGSIGNVRILQHKSNDFMYLEHLVRELNSPSYVESMIIKNNTNNNNLDSNENNVHYCKVLTDGHNMDLPIYEKINWEPLSNLIYLRKLIITLGRFIHLYKDFFTTLNNSCKNLEYLQLDFCTIEEFVPVDSIKELVLYDCRGLSGQNLITILSQHKNLTTFSSMLIKYEGVYKFKEISQQLQHIELRYNIMDNHLMWLLDLKNITSLHWTDSVTTKQNWINAINCPNLQILEVKTTHLNFRNIQGFKHLKKFILNVCENLDAEDFWYILQHPSLIYLKFHIDPEYNHMNYKDYFRKAENDDSWILSIRYIDVCLPCDCQDFFDFWLTLLGKNLNFSLRILYNCFLTEYEDEDYNNIDYCVDIVDYILYSSHRPKTLNTINICGVDVGNYYI